MKFHLCALFYFLLTTTGFAQEIRPDVDVLKFGVHPYLTAKHLQKRFTPLLAYLSEQLGKPVVLEISKSYNDHVDIVGKDEVDIAYVGPAPYVKLTEMYGQKHLLANIQVNGNSTFRGVIFVPTHSSIKTLADLQGKSFAFGSMYSTMSHNVPLYVMWEAGISVSKLATHQHMTHHENVTLAVLMGEFEAGAVKEDVFRKDEAQGLRAIAWTPPIATHVFVATNRLKQEEAEYVQSVLLALNNVSKGDEILTSIKSSITGLTVAKDDNYNKLRKILKVVACLDSHEKKGESSENCQEVELSH